MNSEPEGRGSFRPDRPSFTAPVSDQEQRTGSEVPQSPEEELLAAMFHLKLQLVVFRKGWTRDGLWEGMFTLREGEGIDPAEPS